METTTATTTVYEGVTYYYHGHHGGWFSREDEAIGSLYAAANADGSFAADSVCDVEFSWFDVQGEVCEAACSLCVEEAAKDATA